MIRSKMVLDMQQTILQSYVLLTFVYRQYCFLALGVGVINIEHKIDFKIKSENNRQIEIFLEKFRIFDEIQFGLYDGTMGYRQFKI